MVKKKMFKLFFQGCLIIIAVLWTAELKVLINQRHLMDCFELKVLKTNTV